jgi:hypothetical protein
MEYTILRKTPTPGGDGTNPGSWILVRRDHDLHPFITAWRADNATQWDQGNYHSDLQEAIDDYNLRSNR